MRTYLMLLGLAWLPSLAGCASSKWAWQPRTDAATVAKAKEDAAKPASETDSTSKTDSKTVAKDSTADKPTAAAAVAQTSAAADNKTGSTSPPKEVTATVTAAKPELASAGGTSSGNDANPFKSSRPIEASASVTMASTDTRKSTGGLPKETLLLIDRELQDASTEERVEWFEQLKNVDPAVIPEILRARRMSLQLAQKVAEAPAAPAGMAPAGIAPGNMAASGIAASVAHPASYVQAPAATSLPATPAASSGASPMREASRPGVNPWTPPAANSSPADPFGVIQAGHAAGSERREVMHANFETGSAQPRNLEQALYQQPAGAQTAGIVLQNHEVAAPQSPLSAPRTDMNASRWSSPAATAQPMVGSPGPQAIPWPAPPAREAAPPAATGQSGGFSAVAAHIPFGSNIVQNVVGLVPGRQQGAPANSTAVELASSTATISPAGGFSEQLAQATSFLEQEVVALTPGTTPEAQAAYIRRHVALRLMYLMGEHQERALTAIPGLPPAEQEFWQQLIWGMTTALDTQHIPHPKDRASQTITQLNAAIRRLQEQADLQVRHVTFCRQIQYFGNYEKLPRNEFSPGQEALLYAELDNFKSEPTAEGQYRTLLRSTIEILSPSGELRKQIEFPATEDLCSTYRRDYFHNYQFRIPERMPLGPHVIKLTVFDELSGKMSSYTLNFLVK